MSASSTGSASTPSPSALQATLAEDLIAGLPDDLVESIPEEEEPSLESLLAKTPSSSSSAAAAAAAAATRTTLAADAPAGHAAVAGDEGERRHSGNYQSQVVNSQASPLLDEQQQQQSGLPAPSPSVLPPASTTPAAAKTNAAAPPPPSKANPPLLVPASPSSSSSFSGAASLPTALLPHSLQGQTLRKVPLSKISAQLVAEVTRREAGLPTCVAASSRLIAIGSSHGLCLVYDYQQRVRFILGSSAAGMKFGPVTSICLSSTDDAPVATTSGATSSAPSGSSGGPLSGSASPGSPSAAAAAAASSGGFDYLIAGFEKGQIAIWELQQGKLLKAIEGSHDRSVLNIDCALPDLSAIVTSDAKGAVFVHNVRRVMGIWVSDSRCLIGGGSKAAVSSLACLLPGLGVSYPLDELSVLCMTTRTKIHIVALKPQVDMLHTLSKDVISANEQEDSVLPKVTVYGASPSSSSSSSSFSDAFSRDRSESSVGSSLSSLSTTLPCIAWRRATIYGEGKKRGLLHPMLACSFDEHIRLIEIVCSEYGARSGDLPASFPQQQQQQQQQQRLDELTTQSLINTALTPQTSSAYSATSAARAATGPDEGFLASLGSPLALFPSASVASTFSTFMSSNTISFVKRGHLEMELHVSALEWMGTSSLLALDSRERLNVIDAQSMQVLQVVPISDLQPLFHTRFQPLIPSPSSGPSTPSSLGSSFASRPHSPSVTSLSSSTAALTAALKRPLSHRPCMVAQRRGNHVFLIGQNTVLMTTLFTWSERLFLLVRQGHFLEALSLGLSFYEGKGKAVVGLPLNAARRQEIVGAQLADLLVAYVDISLASPPSTAVLSGGSANGSNEPLVYDPAFIQGLATVCIDYGLLLRRPDLLFGDLYEKLCGAASPAPGGGRGIFIELLEPYILADRVSSLSPIVMKDLVEHFRARDMLQKVERCLLHMDVVNLDIHQVVTLCRQHRLYSALIYVYNRGLRDFITPMEELFHFLSLSVKGKAKSASHDTGKPSTRPSAGEASKAGSSERTLGYKLLLYISYCLTGRAFPTGTLVPDVAKKVKSETYNFILARSSSLRAAQSSSPAPLSDSFGAGEEQEEIQHPHLRVLLMFDAKEFFNLLSLSFEDADLDPASPSSFPMQDSSSAGGSKKKSSKADSLDAVSLPPLPDRQLIVDILLETYRIRAMAQAFVQQQRQLREFGTKQPGATGSAVLAKPKPEFHRSTSHPQAISSFSPTEITLFFLFLARQLCRYSTYIQLDRGILDLMVRYLTDADGLLSGDSASAAEKLQAAPGTGGAPEPRVNLSLVADISITAEEREEALTQLFVNGHLRHIDEDTLLILAESAQFFKILESLYESRRQYAKILSIYLRDPSRKRQAIGYIHRVLSSAAATSDPGATPTAAFYTDQDREEVLRFAVSSAQQLALADRRACARLIMLDFPEQLAAFTEKLHATPLLEFELLHNIVDPTLLASMTTAATRQARTGQSNSAPASLIPVDVNERYIELLCEFAPHQVYSYLRTQDNYRLEECLRVCKKFQITDATAWLLERSGDIAGAFALVLESLKDRIAKLCHTLISGEVKLSESTAAADGEVAPRVSAGENGTDESAKPAASKAISPEIRSAIARAHAVLTVAIQLCQRNSTRIAEAERDSLWFQMLDTVMEPQRQLKLLVDERLVAVASDAVLTIRQRIASQLTPAVVQSLTGELKSLTQRVLSNMIGYVPLKTVLFKVLQDPNYNTGNLGDIKELVIGMVDTYHYETTLLQTTNHLIAGDLIKNVSQLYRGVRKGIMPRQDYCGICERRIVRARSNDEESISVFHCGHAFHVSCLGEDPEMMLHCNICSKKSAKVQKSGKRRALDTQEYSISLEDQLNSASQGSATPSPLPSSSAPSPVNSAGNAAPGGGGGGSASSGLRDSGVEALVQLKKQLALPNTYKFLKHLGDESVGIGLGGLSLIQPDDNLTKLQIAPPSLAIEREKRRRDRVAGVIQSRVPGSLPKAAVSVSSVGDGMSSMDLDMY